MSSMNVAGVWGAPPLEEEETGLDELGGLRDSVFVGQLTPEMMDLVLRYDQIIFVDAHIDPALGNLHCSAVDPDDAGLTFTHSMTPATLLAFVKALHGRDLEGRLISIYGHSFDFQRNLSPETETLVVGAADLVSSL